MSNTAPTGMYGVGNINNLGLGQGFPIGGGYKSNTSSPTSGIFGTNAQPGNPDSTTGGQLYNTGNNIAGVGGVDSQGESNTSGMLGTMAAGGGPNPANASLQQATQQGQAFAQAQAGSARGNMGMAGAEHGAMQTGANVGQQAAQQGSVNVQNQQFQAIQMQMQQQQAQRAQDLMAQGMNSAQAIAQAQLETQASMQNAKTNSGFLGAGAGGAAAGLGMAAMMLL